MKPSIPPLSKLLGKFETTGEIFVLPFTNVVGAYCKILSDDYCFDDTVLRGNVYRLYCVNQPRIKHYSCGNRGGFELRLSFQIYKVPNDIYNELVRAINNLRMAFFVKDGKGNIQVLCNWPLTHPKISIAGYDAEYHIIRASVHAGPTVRPISMLVHKDGSPVTLEEFEEYVVKE